MNTLTRASVERGPSAAAAEGGVAEGRPDGRGQKVEKTMRLQLALPEKSVERLDRLKEITEAASYAEVIRNAIRIYEALVLDIEGGKEISARSPDGSVETYRIF